MITGEGMEVNATTAFNNSALKLYIENVKLLAFSDDSFLDEIVKKHVPKLQLSHQHNRIR
jgi:hypothetical protein